MHLQMKLELNPNSVSDVGRAEAFSFVGDPDGNTWSLQQLPPRANAPD